MSPSPSIPRSKRQTTAAAALTAAALAALAFGCAAPAAQAAGGRGSDAGIPGSTAGTPTTRDPAAPTAGVLRWGAGYATPGGSDAVSQLQRDLRRLGERPGPIDGLYGPLTHAAVQRFQSKRGLVVDGEVGLQTERSIVKRLEARRLRLVALRSKSHATAPKERGVLGASDHPGSPATEPAPAPAQAERSSDALSPEWAGLIAGLAVALLVTALWAVSSRRRRAEPGGRAGVRVNVGLAFACLLAAFAAGAAGGALFASQAAPRAGSETTAEPLFSGSHAALAARPLPERSIAMPRPLLERGRLRSERSTQVHDLRPLGRLDEPQLR
jgi:peptidoglycan hydrolase-like protein with peptidoglycan-binding domain